MSLPLSGTRSGRGRGLTPSGFRRLLERLHSDPDQAAAEYERIRRTLVRFFDWRGVERPDECADTVFDRLAHRLEEEVDIQNVPQYALGIARLVALEAARARGHAPLEESYDIAAAVPAGEDELIRSFDECLAQLPEESRTLLLRYYEGGHGRRTTVRKELAVALGITESALRNRVQRLRDRLEACIASRRTAGEAGGL